MSFMDLEKAYDKVNREVWQVLRMYGVGGTLLMDLRVFMLIVYPV